MATLVDALLVTLGLDTREYEKGTKKAEKDLATFDKKRADSEKRDEDAKRKAGKEQEHRFKQQQHQNKEVAEALGAIRKQIIAIGGLFMAGQGMLAFAKSSIDTAAGIGRLSENTGMAVEELAGLDQALERTGGTAQEANSTIENLSKELAKYKSGMDNTVTQYFRWRGDSNHGQLDNAKAYLLGIADLLHDLNKQNPADALMKAGTMGISDNMFNLLKQGRKAVEAQIAAGARMAAINRKQADEARQAQRTWADMATTLASIGRAVLFPILKEIGDWMKAHQKDIEGWLIKLREFMAKLTPQAISKLGDEFRKVGDAIEKIADALVKIQPLLEKLGLAQPQDAQFTQKIAAERAQVVHYWATRHAANAANMSPPSAGPGSGKVHIGQLGPITVTTQATDARGVASGLGSALGQQFIPFQAMKGAH